VKLTFEIIQSSFEIVSLCNKSLFNPDYLANISGTDEYR